MRAALIAGRWLMNRYAFFVTAADGFWPADHASPGITPEKALLFSRHVVVKSKETNPSLPAFARYAKRQRAGTELCDNNERKVGND